MLSNLKLIKTTRYVGITIYKFERNLLCDKEEIISYDNLITDDTKLEYGCSNKHR